MGAASDDGSRLRQVTYASDLGAKINRHMPSVTEDKTLSLTLPDTLLVEHSIAIYIDIT